MENDPEVNNSGALPPEGKIRTQISETNNQLLSKNNNKKESPCN